MINDDPWLTRESAAKYLGLEKKTLANWACSGVGPRFARVGGRPRYRLSDLEAWVEARYVS
ncbi:helix-turn-helix transcriptional regulator [Nocardia arthritidis]|nr:helix-turn-helix domain-containing protein [Nocardia arthritidis]